MDIAVSNDYNAILVYSSTISRILKGVQTRQTEV